MATGTIRKPMMNGYLPCFMVLCSVRDRGSTSSSGCGSALELLDGGVLLDCVGDLLHPRAELVGAAALVHQLVRGGPNLVVELLVPRVEAEAEGVRTRCRKSLVARG